MATSTVVHMTFEEYLATDFKPDREWINGELRERNVGKWEHARVQALLTIWLGQNEKPWGVLCGTEARTLVAAGRVRIPDLVLVKAVQQSAVLTAPPVLVVEVLSPDDSYSDIQERAQDYRAMGVKAIWLVDPKTRTGRMSIEGPDDVWQLAKVLTVPGTDIHVDLDQLFANLTQ
jgi:Uma2 family endonuclease